MSPKTLSLLSLNKTLEKGKGKKTKERWEKNCIGKSFSSKFSWIIAVNQKSKKSGKKRKINAQNFSGSKTMEKKKEKLINNNK